MKSTLAFLVAAVALSGCALVAQQTEPLPLMAGYRDPADQCVGVGENSYTNQFLDHTADLVGCPVGYEGTGVFVTETGAIKVGETDGFELFTVPAG